MNTNFTSIGDLYTSNDDENAFGNFIDRMRKNYELRGVEVGLTYNTPLPIKSKFGNFKSGIYGDYLCLNLN